MIRKLILSLCVALGCVACEETLPAYNTSWCGVQFELDETSLNPEVYSYSFVGKDEALTKDTIWLTVRPQGVLPEKSSRIKLEQYVGQEWKYIYGDDGLIADSILRVIPRQAEAGVHYVPFDDERLAELLTLDAGELEARIPVIVLRDQSLRDTTYTLFFRIVDSEDLKAGDEKRCNIELRIADCLSRPSAWDDWFFAGIWSRVRHEFMIKVTGEDWDNEFIGSLDQNTRNYYLYVFNRELRKENAERAEQGLPPLRVDPNDPNSELTFPTVAYW
ncbi:DUF4843 domain-containing protein [Butyricimonas virosa]|uniref:DUF4843 domain-containing protein n=1 Tax=Butyricimonas virosa TaxID=544645 RepID=UPI003AAD0383